MPQAPCQHTPVLLTEVLSNLSIRAEGIYVDCTFGRGGHTEGILGEIGPSGRILAMDKDPAAIEYGKVLAESDTRLLIRRASFTALSQVCRAEGIFGEVQGVLFDLGVSSPQLADPNRGFGFGVNGPLDMRMDPSQGPSAAEWLHAAAEQGIVKVLWTCGEERYARRIARAIVNTRRNAPIETTKQLAEVVAMASPTRERNKHPATRTFQAIRIHINQEIEALKIALDQAVEVLASGGRLAVISFHSLEDRLVKRFMRSHSREAMPVRGMPVTLMASPEPPPLMMTLKRPIRPSVIEVRENPRARSALLRVAEKR